MYQIDLSPEEKVETLVKVAEFMKIDSDLLLSVYLLMGDSIFCLLSILEKQNVRFPSSSTLRRFFRESSRQTKVILLSAKKYRVGESWVSLSELKPDMVLSLMGVSYELVTTPMVIFGRYYVLAQERIDDDQV